MDPYTPRSRAASRKKNLTLSAKEYTKITGTIASVRRSRLPHDSTDDDLHDGVHSRGSRGNARDEPSFIAETSFVRAPLNSRVGASNAVPKSKGKAKQEPLDHIPLDIQEALILEDLLSVLIGIEGTYITFHPDYSPEDDDPLQGIQFATSSSLDTSLCDLVERILPLGTYYTAITAFVEQRSHLDFGLVNHALCAAVRDMLKDYQTLLCQLEHAFNTSSTFSLQKLWFYVHPTVHTLFLIYQLILELATADDDPSNSLASSSSSEIDPEEEARNEALGLGGEKLKAVLSEINSNNLGVAGGSGIAVKGGEVLTIIYERMQNMSGDPTASKLYGALLNAAGKPYANMLRQWITTGKLVDSYEELLVKESKFINRGILEVDYTDEYWERRMCLIFMQLRDGSTLSSKRQTGVPLARSVGGRLPGGACVPPLLEGWKHKILLAGKYLNVIRECGIEVSQNQNYPDDEELAMDDPRFHKFLEDAYSHANHTLLELLLKNQQLVSRLRSLTRFFFLSQSFFITHFLDLSHTELRKPSKSASVVKLQSLLELALNTDAHGEDILFREDIKITLADTGLYEFLMKVVSVTGGAPGGEDAGDGEVNGARGHHGHGHGHGHDEHKKEKEDKKTLTAIDSLTFDYNVRFPLSLVISRKTVLRYQLLFRFLLHLKHVEQSLSTMWIEQKTGPWRKRVPENDELERWRLRVCLLRARMLSFVQQILAFATFEVLEPNWRALESKLEKVTTVDQLLRDHVDFLDTCLKECMLTSSRLLKAYSRLIVTCSTFALYTSSFTKSAHQAMAALNEDDRAMAKRWDFLHKFETNFSHWFQVHLNCVQYYASSENVSLLPLVVRLNSVKMGT
ncbi:gamma-tubulin complex, DGRIP84/SPC97 component [Amanita rubescens]|nr:gamma-tubulin complex, DGRIP84/SPC97 component [Amanita rubescens]